MLKPQKPENEAARLAALHRYEILDTDGESAFDDLVAIVAGVCSVPMASVSLVDADRQWFKAQQGLGDSTETSRDVSFCGHAILNPLQPLIVPDALLDERFCNNPLVTGEPCIRFYAGAPLLGLDGVAVGTLCVMDVQPRRMEDFQVRALQALSRQVSYLLELRRVSRQFNLQLQEREWYEQQLQHYQTELEAQNADLAEQTRTDPLTGLPNRRAFAAALAAQMQKPTSGHARLAIAVLDIDHFKNVNDLHGHAEGDRVLVELAAMLKAQFAGRGMAARYGGEEFVLLMPDTTLEEARLQCEYVRQGVAVLPLGLPLTVSIGLACQQQQDGNPEDMFKRADEALYRAKRNGRDQVVVA